MCGWPYRPTCLFNLTAAKKELIALSCRENDIMTAPLFFLQWQSTLHIAMNSDKKIELVNFGMQQENFKFDYFWPRTRTVDGFGIRSNEVMQRVRYAISEVLL